MADDSPVDVGVLELLDGDLTGESTVGLVEDILGGNANLGVGELAGQGEVQSRGRDDDLGGGVELGVVEVLNDAGDALLHTVPMWLSMVCSSSSDATCYAVEGYANAIAWRGSKAVHTS